MVLWWEVKHIDRSAVHIAPSFLSSRRFICQHRFLVMQRSLCCQKRPARFTVRFTITISHRFPTSSNRFANSARRRWMDKYAEISVRPLAGVSLLGRAGGRALAASTGSQAKKSTRKSTKQNRRPGFPSFVPAAAAVRLSLHRALRRLPAWFSFWFSGRWRAPAKGTV